MSEITPTLFVSSVAEAQARLNTIGLDDPLAGTVQIDIADGQLIDALLLSPSDLPELEFGSISCDLHLMVEEPLDSVYELQALGGELPVRQVIGQVERMSRIDTFVGLVTATGWLPGLSFDLYTDAVEVLRELDAEEFETLAVVQLMGNRMGQEGQSLHPGTMARIKAVQKELTSRGSTAVISVDIGVNEHTIEALSAAGATQFAVGSGLWQADDMKHAYQQLESLL